MIGRTLGLLGRHRILRFLLVGGVNTLVGYGMFAALFAATGAAGPAAAAAMVLGVIFNFFTTGRLVFRNRSARAFVPFVAAYGVALTLNLGLLHMLLRVGTNAYLAQAICLPVVVLTAYAINSRLVFR